MSKSSRLSEKWFRRGLWVVAFIFGSFLISLGGKIIDDLPHAEKRPVVEDYMDTKTRIALETSIQKEQRANEEARIQLEQAQLQKNVAAQDYTAAYTTFNNWLATRQATQNPDQDSELISRRQALEVLKNKERAAGIGVEKQQQAYLNARQAVDYEQKKLDELRKPALKKLEQELRYYELRIFLYRLALTLPLLIIAGWLFAKKRKTRYWPFVWGFIYFAVFAFFVELVPYLPNYGGYVRYIVGILLTIIIGRQAILALTRYLEKQKIAEQLPDAQRRKELTYDTAFALLSKTVCPGCERNVELKNPEMNFCPHCGINLFNHCASCNTRKSAFAKFCCFCGK